MDFFQINCFKAGNNMEVKKTTEQRKTYMKNNVFGKVIYKIFSYLKNLSKLMWLQACSSGSYIKGATKLYFTLYLCVVIISYSTGLPKSAFSTYYFGKLVFRPSVFYLFSVCCEFITFTWSFFIELPSCYLYKFGLDTCQ